MKKLVLFLLITLCLSACGDLGLPGNKIIHLPKAKPQVEKYLGITLGPGTMAECYYREPWQEISELYRVELAPDDGASFYGSAELTGLAWQPGLIDVKHNMELPWKPEELTNPEHLEHRMRGGTYLHFVRGQLPDGRVVVYMLAYSM